MHRIIESDGTKLQSITHQVFVAVTVRKVHLLTKTDIK